MYSNVQARQPWIVLVLIKPYWFRCISGMMACCSLDPSNFVTIFVTQLTSDIGMKSLIVACDQYV
jgi:hypothetical protein